VSFRCIIKYEKLYKRRIEAGLTHKAMALKLNISKSYYCQIENANRTLSYGMAYKISKILNTKPDELFYKDYSQKKA